MTKRSMALMADSPIKRSGPNVKVGDIDVVDLMLVASDDGALVWEHINNGGDVLLVNPISNKIRRLIKTQTGFSILE